MKRIDNRAKDALRPVEIIPNVNRFAEGSCLIKCGDTQVYITASVEFRTPPHVPMNEGWVTAEYNMLPRANRERSRRDVSKLKLSGRSAEIQRLIGRSLRAAVDLKKLPGIQITIDCDVLQGDGGTRTASITGGFVALALACRRLQREGSIKENPIIHNVAAISAGIVENALLLDLRYEEDSSAMVDLNCVMTEEGKLIEIQGTGEGRPFGVDEQQKLVNLCARGIGQLIDLQNRVLAEA
ncbi:MAG: ribonuclease PH [Candidatus Onthomonas sp.]